MTAEAVDVVRDPLLTPVLALLMTAINADVGYIMDHDGGYTTPACATTQLHPLDLKQCPDNEPRLSAYRIRSRPVRTSMQRIDHVATVQFDYITPSCGDGQLTARWPLLETVWQVIVETLDRGYHEDYLDGEIALTNVLKVDLSTASKVELYADGGDLVFPAFRAQIDITWRGRETRDPTTYYPALDFTIAIHRADLGELEDGEDVAQAIEPNPAVVVISRTPTGQEALDTPFADEADLQEESIG
jgi:hypothetical protein